MAKWITNLLGVGMVCMAYGQQAEPYFLSYPALSPDGSYVVFSYEGDLWKVPAEGGQAMRLTAMQGYEYNARISPNGQWIAFTGRQYGNNDVFVMPASGGEIQQLTWHSASDDVNSWSWDSEFIYFTSNRQSRQAGFKVPLKGGTPIRVFSHYYFNYDHNLWEHPQTGEIYFTDSWESASQAYRKRYKGPFAPNILSYDLKSNTLKKHTNYEGKDFSHSIDKQGHVYFMSDELNGEYNLYTLLGGKKQPLTRYNTSIKNAQVNANGNKVVFEKDYQLYLYDITKGKTDKIKVELTRNYILPKDKEYAVSGNISAFDVSPDGKKLAFISRGEVFVSDVEGKFVKQLQRGSAERATEVKWMADSKSLLLLQTKNGFTNLYTLSADGSQPLKEITKDAANARFLTLNSKKTQAAFISGRGQVKLLDTKNLEVKTLLTDEIWGNRGSAPYFSPNDEYLIFNVYRNFETDIMVHHLKTGVTTNLTNSGVSENDPMWSPDSKYIYFTGNPLKPSYPTGLNQAKVYRVSLQKLDEPYRLDKFEELFKPTVKDTTKKKDTVTSLTIDIAQFLERMEPVGPSFGSQYLTAIIQKADKQTVLYQSNHAEGRMALWKTVFEPFESPKTEKIQGSDGGVGQMAEADGKYYVLHRGALHKLNLDANKLDAISISHSFSRNLAAEFGQMFEEAWAQMEENFYDDKFRGLDWAAIKKRYASYLPCVNSRNDLRVLLNDMLGELNSSHTGFSSQGDEENLALNNRTAETGIEFENTKPYTVSRIIARSPADKKGVNIKPGDVLVAVNGEAVNPVKNRNMYFTQPALLREIKLTFKRGAESFDISLHPAVSVSGNLYDEWIDANQKRVDDKTKQRIAYVHMKDMGGSELNSFLTDMARDFYQKDGLIFDLRYNTGGNAHAEVLRFLSQRTYLNWKYRNGSITGQSNFAPADKPIVLLINEQSLSDAEMTAAGFKALKLGTVIGNETYRWIIFTTGAGLVDGSFLRLPSWGCYTLDGKDLEFAGVQPDIKVLNSFEDKQNGRDPQLDKAIEFILEQVKAP